VVIERKPRARQKQPTVQKQAVAQKQATAAVAAKPATRQPQSQNRPPQTWQQRRQELLRRERTMSIAFGLVCLAGTLVMLYVAGQASATSEGYQLAELSRKIKEEDAKHVQLLSDIRRLEDSNAMAKEVAERKLVRTSQGIHYFGEKRTAGEEH
jgi:cell division protein FtsL